MKIMNRLKIILISIIQKIGLSPKIVDILHPDLEMEVFNIKGHFIRYSDIDDYKRVEYTMVYQRKMKMGRYELVDSHKYYNKSDADKRPLDIVDKIAIVGITSDVKFHDMSKEDRANTHYVVHIDGIIELINSLENNINGLRSIKITVPTLLSGRNGEMTHRQKIALINLIALLSLRFKLNHAKALSFNSEFAKNNNIHSVVLDVNKKINYILKNIELYEGVLSNKFTKKTKLAIRKMKPFVTEVMLGINADYWLQHGFWKINKKFQYQDEIGFYEEKE